MARIAVGGSGSEALLAGAVARGPSLPRVLGVTADLVLTDSVLAGVRVQAALPGTSLHWRPRAEGERTCRQAGGSPANQVMVTASGFVDGSAWQALGGLAALGPHGFTQGGLGDGMRPGPLLEVLAEQAVTGSPRFTPVSGAESARGVMPPVAAAAASASAEAGSEPLAGIPGVPGADGVRRLTDDELLGAMSAAQRLRNRAEWLELSAVAELTRRRYAEEEASIANGDPVGQRAGEFASEEIAFQTTCSGHAAGERMELAAAMAARLPAICARMADGAIGSYQAAIAHRATRDLSAGDVATADAILASEAPFLTPEALRRRAARVAMTLDPEAAEKRKKTGAKRRRVEMWPEESGNAALAGREMDPADALAANAYYDALARALRKGGVPGTLRELRHLAYTDRNTGKDPLDRIGRPAADDRPGRERVQEQDPGAELHDGGYREDEPEGYDPWVDIDDEDSNPANNGQEDPGQQDNGPANGGGPAPASPRDPVGTADPTGGTPTPAPANITILVPVGTLLGWDTAPGEASRLGPLGPQAVRDLVEAASRHPRTRWCVTFTGPDGTAAAHGCAPGRHPWTQPNATGPGERAGPGKQSGFGEQSARTAAFLDWLGAVPEPIARGACDHRHRENRYTPSRKLAHLIRARTVTCPAPACGARAEHNDLDHTVPWPEGPTDECNLSPPCRRHHRVKQARGWKLDQPEPGVMRWTTPSGRSYTTRPTTYL